MATTSDVLADVLKQVWTSDRMADTLYGRGLGMEMKLATRDMQRQMNRQLTQQARFSGGEANTAFLAPRGTHYSTFPMSVQVNPSLASENMIYASNPAHRARTEEMMQNYAKMKRKGKPSYRQRQKNAKVARHGAMLRKRDRAAHKVS